MISDSRPATEEFHTVLIVEDEILLRIIVADELREAGMRVIEAGNADEAMSYLSAGNPIAFVFTDIELPGSMNGLDLARRLQASSPDLKMLVTSGRRPAYQSLAPFIPKPYQVANVVARIRAALADNTPK